MARAVRRSNFVIGMDTRKRPAGDCLLPMVWPLLLVRKTYNTKELLRTPFKFSNNKSWYLVLTCLA